MQKYLILLAISPLCLCTSMAAASPNVDSRSPRARALSRESAASGATLGHHATASSSALLPPVADSSGTTKNRFISFSNPQDGTAIRVTLVSLHHVVPPYTRGPSTPFSQFEGQTLFVGPPVRYVESRSSGIPFHGSTLQCEPYYHDWSTVELLHVTGEAIVPSSIYDVEVLGASCQGHEDTCTMISSALVVETSRWGDVVVSPAAPPDSGLVDFGDISATINKFRSALNAPGKSLAMLAGDDARGHLDPSPDLNFNHVAANVDAFTGLPYPHKPGKCSNNAAVGCMSDEDCTQGKTTKGVCLLCGEVAGGACCHSDGTCGILPAYACNQPGDRYQGDHEPCSRCCGPSLGCRPLTPAEWLETQTLWPNIDPRDICREEEEVPQYNCVAWTIGNTSEWVWDELDKDGNGLWEAWEFEEFFAGHQKSAIIYGSNNSAVLHTARPLPNNCASSKAGSWIRLRHDRNQIEGGYYGDILETYAY